MNVYNEVVYSTNSERADIDYHLGRAINPLILAERAAEGKALKKKERAERRALDRKVSLVDWCWITFLNLTDVMSSFDRTILNICALN